jgi:alcohol dehydrogenase class IV
VTGPTTVSGGGITGSPLAGLAFSLEWPTRIRFGRGARDGIGPLAAELGRHAAIVTGRNFAGSPELQRVTGSLAAAGVEVVVHIIAAGEPDTRAVLAATARLVEARVDLVVAIGGGSAIDLAKASALRPSSDALAGYLAGARLEHPTGLPVICLPTTAGSGSEVSHAAIILDRDAGRKRGIRGPGVAARLAIVDPDLIADLPPAVTASSAFDALAHATETAVSRAATPHVIAWSGIALAALLDVIPRSLGDDVAPADRETAAYASMLMGLNLAASTTCLPHRLQYPVGARTGCGHAEGVAAIMPAWLKRTVRVAPERLARLAVAAGLVSADEPIVSSAETLREHVERQLDRTGMLRRLSDFGIVESDLDGLVAAVEGSLSNDPGPTAPADLRALYLASL